MEPMVGSKIFLVKKEPDRALAKPNHGPLMGAQEWAGNQRRVMEGQTPNSMFKKGLKLISKNCVLKYRKQDTGLMAGV